MKRIVVAIAMLSPLAAASQELPEGIYLTPPERCEDARRDGIESVLEQGELMLTRRGLEGYEYHCEFIEVARSSRTLGWLVTALCEEPGYGFPDIIAIMQRGEGELELTSMSGSDGEGGNDGLYGLCEGVSPP